MSEPAVDVTALAVSAQLGGTERVLLDFAARAFEDGIVLRVLVPREGPLIGHLESAGIPVEVVPASAALLSASQQPGRAGSLAGGLKGIAGWVSQLRRHPFLRRADAVYSVGFKSHIAARLAARGPLVWHLHEFPPDRYARGWRFLARHLPSACVANSHATARAWLDGDTGPRKRPVVAVPNGVDLDQFKLRHRTFWIHSLLGIPRERRLIGMPAAWARWKGQLEIVDAFERVSARFPDVHLLFIGGSIYDTVAERDFTRELESRVERANAAAGPAGPRIHFLPFQQKIENVYPELDLVLHYSLRPEAFGKVILEAMSSGLPVVAAAEGGPLEILGAAGPGRVDTGWLVEPRNPALLAETLETVLPLSQVELREIGLEGRRRAERHFSARRFSRGVAEVIRSTLP